ncbi:class I SAM-dependent methyltransferase [Flavimarina sp. Hel_I_48]|uniref:class I SAM-dependent methyltransferase n=1 Tax=Flavimarina sp. Hel_I_48 TaxID=1392488 RepID=UPI0004DF6190|nr:class I SAM-dependent methyltransferase [Flavimarina sp. Hel_I_48]
MYEKVKKILPKKFIKSNENVLRHLIALLYVGTTYQCNICDFKMSRFIKLNNHDNLCPRCGSLARTRRLWEVLQNEIKGKTILHFSPSRSLKKKMESFEDINYITSDYAGEFEATKKLNIEEIDEPDATYDIVICYHVLEHIEADMKAMKELYRILKPQGKCVIQTPFKAGETYENDQVKTDSERLAHFGQKDHVRIYSAHGLLHRLEQAGFKARLQEYTTCENNKHGYNLNEKVIIAEKPVSIPK